MGFEVQPGAQPEAQAQAPQPEAQAQAQPHAHQPAAAQTPFAAQQAQSAYVVQPKTNMLAVVSLVCGILWIFWLGSIVAVVTGHMAKEQIESSGRAQSGQGLAIAGLVLGWLGIGPILLIVGCAALGSAGSS